MTGRQHAVISIIATLVLGAGLVHSTAEEPRRSTAPDLAGLWEGRRDFGPEVRGTLDLYKHGERWTARIAGFEAPVTLEQSRVTFEIQGDRGRFRGHLDRAARVIRGHWIQPPTAANRVRFASPVDLVRRDGGHWRGEVTPLDDTMTFFLSLTRRQNGSLGGFLRNPEANFGRHFEIEDVTLEGDTLRFVEPGRPEARLRGSYHPDYEAFSLFIPDAGGTFDFIRVDDDEASPFYPRPSGTARYSYHPPSSEDDGWQTATLEEVGMATGPIEEMIRMIVDTPMDSITAPYIHAVLIARHGKLVLEEYFHGYSADKPHETRSASKTVTATLIGIASHMGEPLDLDSSVYEIFDGPNLTDGLDPRKRRMTLRHLLTMTPGLACDDNDDESPGSEWRMQSQSEQPDWNRYTLDLPMVHEPGEHVAYCSASPNLAGGMLVAVSGSWLPDLYRNYFAGPMQMGLYHMNLMPNGEGYGGGGLYIRGRDFLKMSQLFLDGGTWKGRKLLENDWVRDAVSPLARMFEQGYGYAWWVLPLPYEDGTVQAFYAGGNGGQYAIGIPALDLAIVFFAGNYSQSVTHLVKKKHIPDFIIKSVERGSR
jgi:CubicO group peptidase (beta-lactamase class C family)